MRQATYNRPPWQRTRAALRVIGEGSILLFCCAVLYGWLLVGSALSEPATNETRCFDTATTQTDYCRTQGDW